MRVIDLTQAAGQFETEQVPGQDGVRTFGLWSMQSVGVGDLVVIQRRSPMRHNVLYAICSVREDAKQMEDLGSRFWEGQMVDVILHNILTPKMTNALHDAGFQ